MQKIGVLLVNLGTPAAPTPAAVRKYLAEFLGDPRVVEIPQIVWKPILHGIVLRLRPKQSAKLYKKVWMEQGSPLLVYSQNLRDKLQQQLDVDDIKIKLAMRYGQPSITHALTEFRNDNIQRLLILPLFPQYSGATTGSIFAAIMQQLQTWRNMPEVRYIKNYSHDIDYAKAMAASIQQQTKTQHLVFSFHGLPQRVVDKGDPYFAECQQTVNAVSQQLQLSSDQYSLAFQSRFGKAAWLQPYFEPTLKILAQQGKKNISVVCPGFAVDCLETLEEIAIRGKESFLEAGGETLTYIPALNDSPQQIKLMERVVNKNIAGWV